MPSEAERPCTLVEWRKMSQTEDHWNARALWDKLNLGPIFLSRGYRLWPPTKDPTSLAALRPKSDWDARVFDGFAYRSPYCRDTFRGSFDMAKTIHCPARTSDGRDVLIRLIAVGSDREEDYQKAMDRLAVGTTAALGDNHVLPILDKIEHDDMLFHVFPLMDEGFVRPWYFSFAEIVDACEQVLEGINFCHERLVAHLDLDDNNILLNCSGDLKRPLRDQDQNFPFRSLFPARYYIIDFELCAVFDFDSDPATRLVQGIPTARRGGKLSNYGRHAAPEMLLDEPYCPFRADIWQLGTLCGELFGHLGDISRDLVDLLNKMRSNNPKSRPTSSDALAELRRIKRSLTPDALWRENLPEYPERPMPPAVEKQWREFDEEMKAKSEANPELVQQGILNLQRQREAEVANEASKLKVEGSSKVILTTAIQPHSAIDYLRSPTRKPVVKSVS